jgi:polar amino acid transport system substrate-binding protein
MKIMKTILLLLLFLSSLFAHPNHLEKVSLQLMWLDQFQFAGYYMAKEKGFYEGANLDVEIKKFKYNMNTVDEVVSGRATFGIGRSGIIKSNSDGKKIVLISAIFQSSPFVLISLKSSNIKSVKDFVHKKIMFTTDAVESASIRAMIMSSGIDNSKIIFKEHNFDLEELINKKVDLYAGYVSNEVYELKKRGLEYHYFSPKNEWFDFYSDLLFTSLKEVEKNPSRVSAFKQASLKGWKYAFDNIEETIKIIYDKYNPQNKTMEALRYEARELKKLAYLDDIELGNIDEKKISRIFDIYKIMGIAKNTLNINEILFESCSKMISTQEQNYLRSKKEIKICASPASLPYSAIEDSKLIGISASILDITGKHVFVPHKLVETTSWKDSLQKVKNRECDVIPMIEATPSRKKYLNFTTPYYNEPMALVTKKSKKYVLDINNLLDQTFSIIEGSSYIVTLKKNILV